MFITKYIIFSPLFFIKTQASNFQNIESSTGIEVICKKVSGFDNSKYFPKEIKFSSSIFTFLEEINRVSADVTGWDVYAKNDI